jgi:hypothetical protein
MKHQDDKENHLINPLGGLKKEKVDPFTDNEKEEVFIHSSIQYIKGRQNHE